MFSLRSTHPRQIAERMKSEEGGALQGRLCILGYAWTTMPSKHLACGFLREAMRYTSFVLFLCRLMHSSRFTASSRPALLLSGGKQSRVALHRCTRHFRLAFAHFSFPLQLSVYNLQGRGLYTPGTSQSWENSYVLHMSFDAALSVRAVAVLMCGALACLFDHRGLETSSAAERGVSAA
jgi:hypothetical protein